MRSIHLLRKPLSESTVAANTLLHGAGGLNIDESRISSDGSHLFRPVVVKRSTMPGDKRTGKALGMYGAGASFVPTNHTGGRWPANLVLQHLSVCFKYGACAVSCPVDGLDQQSGAVQSGIAIDLKVGLVKDHGASRYFKQVVD